MNSISIIYNKMVDVSVGNFHDIEHFTNVWKYAAEIGRSEGLDERTEIILEAAALTHDIACPLCREKYGSTIWKYQEIEGMPLAREILQGTGLSNEDIDRVVYLVGHHHTLTEIDDIDYQILIEADYIVNALEGGYSPDDVSAFNEKYFRTVKGKELLEMFY